MTINWQATKNFITEKTDTAHNAVAEVLQKAKNSVSDVGNNQNPVLDPVKNPVINSIQQKTSQVVDSLTTTSEQAKNSISQFSNQTTHQITETANQAKDTVLQAGKTIKDSVGNTVLKTESLSQSAVDTVQTAINNMIQSWINEHPKISWLINHPLASLILFIIIIGVIFGLFQAMGSLIKDAWLLILTSPFKMFRASFQWSFQSLFKTGTLSKTSLNLHPQILSMSPVAPASVRIEHQERLTKICQRLEEIHQEERQLLEELKTIIENP